MSKANHVAFTEHDRALYWQTDQERQEILFHDTNSFLTLNLNRRRFKFIFWKCVPMKRSIAS